MNRHVFDTALCIALVLRTQSYYYKKLHHVSKNGQLVKENIKI